MPTNKRTHEQRLKERLSILQRDIDDALRRIREAEEDVREAQERVQDETDMYDSACAEYADLVAGRKLP